MGVVYCVGVWEYGRVWVCECMVYGCVCVCMGMGVFGCVWVYTTLPVALSLSLFTPQFIHVPFMLVPLGLVGMW